jgi:hypothetical protein
MATGRVYLLVQVLRASLHRELELQPTTRQLDRMFRQCQLQWRLRVCLRRDLAVLLIDLNIACRKEEVAPRDRNSTQRADGMYKVRSQDGFPYLLVRPLLEH